MRLRKLIRKLKLSLAVLVGGLAFACSGPNPGEMPPLAPRPDRVQPVPTEPSKVPVPGAPDFPTPPDAGAPVPLTRAEFKGSVEPQHGSATPADAGVSDATVLPEEVPDALPPDANRRPRSTAFACC
jgi:hypothetical protein